MAHQGDWPDSANLGYVERLYARYLRDPNAVEPTWRHHFDHWAGERATPYVGRVGPSFAQRSIFDLPAVESSAHLGHGEAPRPPVLPGASSTPSGMDASLQHRVDQLIRNYRVRGHIVAAIDPLGQRHDEPPEMNPAYYGMTEADLDRHVVTSNLRGPTLREILTQLSNTYCRNIGAQFMHIDDLRVREWLQRRMERTENRTELTRKEQIRILTRLTDAVIFEQFIQRKFIGAKSFSLEGAESLIPLLDMALETAGDQGIKEVVIGMAHRGRLNILANIIGKSPQKIFREFEDVDPRRYLNGGDVKYHMGYSGDWRTRHGQNLHLSLCFNPSHLEYVNTVALGRLRAKQDRTGLITRGDKGMVVLIHGDAAFAGEGIVQETLNLSNLEGYGVGGTLHLIVNNQIGFTTSAPEARSCRYATDVAKMLQIPIFHVNGEQPEAVTQVIRLAMDFRAEFKRDVVVDMYCYRKRGHNESDEPSYTQPQMYDLINQREGVRERYLHHLMELGGVSEEDADRIAQRRHELLEKELTAARSDHYVHTPGRKFEGHWADYHGGKEDHVDDVPTGVEAARLCQLIQATTQLPSDFNLHPKLKRQMKHRLDMADGQHPLDWAAGETLAYASLVTEGHRVRLSGQDAQRGTFSHRHAVLHDYQDGHTYTPLQHLTEDQAPIEIINSPLSESGVLGFDYGYSLESPETLVIWEAQFGDFVNVAQVIIDQFIASAEEKWHRLSGLVLLLPHGLEGQGPEHSSARLERFLAMSAEDNIQVAQPSTPSQIYHLLRRQVLRQWRKPLVVMTPKSLLRNPACVSPLQDFEQGTFKRVIADPDAETRQSVSRVLLCTGKIYYELIQRRAELHRNDIDIIRIEQLYPFPEQTLRNVCMRYSDTTPMFWVQDEPSNMGAWPYVKGRFCHRLFDRLDLHVACRPASSSPATGSRAAHRIEQEQLLSEAFGGG